MNQNNAANFRKLLVINGEKEWCLSTISGLNDNKPQLDILNFSHDTTKIAAVLGAEFDIAIYNTFSGFDPDALGAIAGTIRAGGLLMLLTPYLDSWPNYPDPELKRIVMFPYTNKDAPGYFVKRFIKSIHSHTDSTVITQGETESPKKILTKLLAAIPVKQEKPSGWISEEQQTVIQAIQHVAQGHRHRPLVITADRGRGKSASLGIAAAELLKKGLKKILVTAPRQSSLDVLFMHAYSQLEGAQKNKNSLHWGDCHISFITPDQLRLNPQPCDLLLIDEAAGIPTPILAKLLKRYARIVFATTVHGYEGTGRGFALRFVKELNRTTPQWKSLSMKRPIRWDDNDPLETFIFNGLLLNSQIGDNIKEDENRLCSHQVETITQDDLAQNEDTLSQLFGLLVLAHYRTRPRDLRQLLDAPGITIYLVRNQQQTVIATAITVDEGGLDNHTAELVYKNKRRLQGHLISQSLASHAAFRHAPSLRYRRIMRIAVHPQVQRDGIGTLLTQQIITDAGTSEIDMVGTSFGATEQLLNFWQKNQFSAVRIGFKREQSSGTHSAIFLHPLSEPGIQLCQAAHTRFVQQLPLLLSDVLSDIDPQLALSLLQHTDNSLHPQPTQQEWQEIIAFVQDGHGYESCMPAIWTMVCHIYQEPRCLTLASPQQHSLVIRKVLQRHSWSEVVDQFPFNGRTQAIEQLRESLKPLVLNYADQVITD